METFFLVVTLILMIAGLVGAVLPVLPSLPIIYAGYLIFGVASGWAHYGWGVMILFGLVTALTAVLDYVAGAAGARRYGASRAGVIGSLLGAIIGVIVFNVPGLILGPFVGALLGELIWGRTFQEAFRSGWGAFLGFVAGVLLKLVVGSVMIGAFLFLVIF